MISQMKEFTLSSSDNLEPVSILHMRGGVCQNDALNVFIINWDDINGGEIGYTLEIIDQLVG